MGHEVVLYTEETNQLTSQLTNQPTNQPANQPGHLSLKVEYLSNHWLDITENSNLSLGGQTNFHKCKWRWPPVEDDLKY